MPILVYASYLSFCIYASMGTYCNIILVLRFWFFFVELFVTVVQISIKILLQSFSGLWWIMFSWFIIVFSVLICSFFFEMFREPDFKVRCWFGCCCCISRWSMDPADHYINSECDKRCFLWTFYGCTLWTFMQGIQRTSFNSYVGLILVSTG